eukprot:jgi/Mesvir1/10179/Mv05154-RA.1
MTRDAQATSPLLLTLVLLRTGDKVLLGKKLRGPGAGLYNGFGGKVEEGESVWEAAHRELEEECCVRARQLTLQGVLQMHFDDQDRPWEIHVFGAHEWDGSPQATDEMEPRWFPLDAIPYENMWADDPIWMPLFFQGAKFRGRFYFTGGTQMQDYSISEVDSLS